MLVPACRSEGGGQPRKIMNWCLTSSLGAVIELRLPPVGFRHTCRLISAPECLFWNATGAERRLADGAPTGGTARLAQARPPFRRSQQPRGRFLLYVGGGLDWVQLVFAEPREVRSWLVEAPREGAPDLAAGMRHATGDVTGLAAGAGYLGIGADAFRKRLERQGRPAGEFRVGDQPAWEPADLGRGAVAGPSRARHDQYADLGADRGGTRGPPGEPIRTNRKGPAMTLQPPGGRRRRRRRPWRRAGPPDLAHALARLTALLPPEAAEMLAHADVLTCSDGRIFVYSPSPPRRSNLVFSHSDTGPGVDPFGNPHGSGDVTYWPPGGEGVVQP